jgi:Domain of unknown function (DUF6048)
MKLKHISEYFFSFLLLICFLSTKAQEKAADSVAIKTERYGFRAGIDLFKLARSVYDKDYKGIELVGDYRYNKNYYLAAEIGSESKKTDDVYISSTATGTYLKAGFDYNLHKNWLHLENMIYVGARYSIATFSQELNSYKIYNRAPYFNENQDVVVNEKFSGLSAQWLEVVLGMKTKVVNNFFVGFSLRLNTLVQNKKPNGFDNLYIPGFNRTYDGNFGIGFNYTVSYFLPLYKKTVKTKKSEAVKGEKQ